MWRLAAVAFVLSLGAVPVPVHAGDASNSELSAAERADMNKLQQQLGDDDGRQPTQTADIFGPSDEEKAAAAQAAQHEKDQDANIAALNQRENDIEDQIRRLTGQIEVLNHRIDEMSQRLEIMKKEYDYKLCTMSAQQLAGAGQPSAVPCGSDGQPPPPAAYNAPPQGAQNGPPPQPTGVTRLAPPPGVLGTLPQQDAANIPAPQPNPQQTNEPPPPAQPVNDPHAQYEAAMTLLAKQDYDAAISAFRAFVDANPKDPAVPDALYWMGSASYVQKDFAGAAHSFAEIVAKYPTNKHGPESMLKLGQSLIAMNQKDQGCTTLRALPSKYPGASRSVISQSEAVRRAGGCRR